MNKTIREIETPFQPNGQEPGTSIVKSMVQAFRNFSMYRPDHVLSIQGIETLVSELKGVTEFCGSFAIDIKQDGIYIGDTLSFSSQEDDIGFIFPLVRDGIFKLELSNNIGKNDVLKLFHIIQKNKVLGDRPEGDTVTDLWQADIPHVSYKTVEVFEEQEPLFYFPNPTLGTPEPLIERSFRRSSKKKNGTADPANGEAHADKTEIPEPFKFSEEDITCDPDDLTQLREMVNNHESKQNEDEILDLLLLVIDEVSRADDLENILSNLAVEFYRIINKGDVYKAFTIIETVKEYQETHGWMTSFVDQIVEAFISHVSGNVFKDVNKIVVPMINRNHPDEIYYFKKLCISLAPRVVFSLCEAIVYLESQTAKDFLMNIIKIKTREDVTVIEGMLESTDKMIALIGVSLLKNIKDSNSEILLQRMLHHPVEQVRSSALDYFINKPISVLPQIFFLIDDPNDDVRSKLMKFMGSKRSMATESLLINYLEDLSFMTVDKKHLLACYRVLGECGSEKSLPFLKKRLFGGTFLEKPNSKTIDHRVGALLALRELKNAESTKILAKASKSRVQAVMKAYGMVFSKDEQG